VRTRVARRAAALSLAALVLTVTGCSSSLGPDDGPSGDVYPARTHPDSTIAKLARAYRRMDAEAYLDCLAADFIFFLNGDDIAANPNLPDYWGKAQEREIHEKMFSDSSDVQSVWLTLTQFGQPCPVANPVPGEPDLWEYCENTDLWVHLPNDLTYWANAGAAFLLRVNPDSTGPAGESTWEIAEWQDVNKFTGKRGEESASWGRIKACFLDLW
jgi:hypothetical protein